VSYIKNKNINLLNLHTGIHRFSIVAIFTFGALYLLKQGIKLEIVLIIWCLNFIFRLILRPLSIKISQKIGLKKSVILGILFYSGIFPVISKIDGLNIWVFIFILYFSLADVLYWLPYHGYYAAIGESHNRGKHVGVREMFAMILTSVAPLMSGFFIENYGFWSLYLVSMIVMLLGSIPVFFVSEVSPGEVMSYKKAVRKITKQGLWLLFGGSLAYYSHMFLWSIVLFSIVKSFVIFGGILSLEIFINAIVYLLLGHFIDKGRGKTIVIIGLVSMGIILLSRVFFVYNISTILISEAIFAFSLCFYGSSVNSAFYNLSKKSRNTLWFHFFAEVVWYIGGIISLSLASLFVYLGFELRYFMIFGLVGLFIVKRVLYKYYKYN